MHLFNFLWLNHFVIFQLQNGDVTLSIQLVLFQISFINSFDESMVKYFKKDLII
jgi:hypothetical protein